MFGIGQFAGAIAPRLGSRRPYCALNIALALENHRQTGRVR
jgi:hypothetical protein